ncbi:MAG: hypothetical protein JXR48_17175 [Candidatus Delongbacteria bacterium]|nr:hypothetical protein [Candidatus Delongbacteria bacterium]MBN2836691.1 hypothetical protein [Candidatus Delongbacteria bacterium]
MKPLIILTLLFIFFSCSEYSGKIVSEYKPQVYFESGLKPIYSKTERIGWYSKDNDSDNITYKYLILDDTTQIVDNSDVENYQWSETNENYAFIGFPLTGNQGYYNLIWDIEVHNQYVNGQVYTTYDTLGVDTVWTKFSRLFLYAEDESKNRSEIIDKVFGRINNKPLPPLVSCNEYLSFPKRGVVTLDRKLYFNKYSEFKWRSPVFEWTTTDPDGESSLEYLWELYKLDEDSVLLAKAESWSNNNKSIDLTSYIFDNQPAQNFCLKIKVRDDTETESAYPTVVNFEGYIPTMDKGILLLDYTDDLAYEPDDIKSKKGNPDATEVKNFYLSALEKKGFTIGNPDPLKNIDFVNVQFDSLPKLEVMIQYRLVLLYGESLYNAYNSGYTLYYENVDLDRFPTFKFSSYLDLGGKMMVTGECSFWDSFDSPDVYHPGRRIQAGIWYFDEQRIFPNKLFRERFGIHASRSTESYLYKPLAAKFGNYVFIGTENFDHANEFYPMSIDSAKVNKYAQYIHYNSSGVLKVDYRRKDNGSVFGCASTVEVFNGEPIFKYRSIYDLPRLTYNDSISFEIQNNDTLKHSLILQNRDKQGNKQWVDDRLGSRTCGSRYIHENGKTRFICALLPFYMMDDSEGNATNNIGMMIDWLKLEEDPFGTTK